MQLHINDTYQLWNKLKQQIVTNFYELTEAGQKASKKHASNSDTDDTDEDIAIDPEDHIPWLDNESEDRKLMKPLDREDFDVKNEVNLKSVYLSGLLSSEVTEANKAKMGLKGTCSYKPVMEESNSGVIDWFFW